MNPRAALRELSARGIQVVVTDDRLRLRGPDHVLTAELTAHLRQHKTEILEAARRCPTCCECGAVVGPDETECWWGLDRVHRACGEAAWRREYRPGAPSSPARFETPPSGEARAADTKEKCNA